MFDLCSVKFASYFELCGGLSSFLESVSLLAFWSQFKLYLNII